MKIKVLAIVILVMLLIPSGFLFAGGGGEEPERRDMDRPEPPRDHERGPEVEFIEGPGNNPHFHNGDVVLIKVGMGEPELFLDAIAPEGRVELARDPEDKPGTRWRIFQRHDNIIELRADVPGALFLDAIIPDESVGLADDRLPGTGWEFLIDGPNIRLVTEEGNLYLDAVASEHRLQLVPGPADDRPGTFFEIIFIE